MLREMKDGAAAVDGLPSTPEAESKAAAHAEYLPRRFRHVVNANAGGPYGSSVLAAVQADSMRVWEQVVRPCSSGPGDTGGSISKGKVSPSWKKACIMIEGAEDGAGPWHARAVLPDGNLSKKRHPFAPLPT